MGIPRSLVLITVDCLRADHVGFLGYDRPTTPFLDSLAIESLTFPNAIVAGAPTYYSLPAIMASRYPLALGRDVIGLAPDEPTIASTLNQAGYATSAFLAGNPYLSRRFGYDAGFDTFRDFLDADIGRLANSSDGAGKGSLRGHVNRGLAQLCHRLGPVGSLYDELYFQYCQRVAAPPAPSLDVLRRFPAADVVVDQAQAWLAGLAGRPFFMWIHFMDPHSPYYPPAKALERMGHDKPKASQARYLNSYWNRGDLTADRLKRHRDEVIALYDAGIRWVDEQVARLVESLRDFRAWDSCVLALTADHGEEFLEHGGRYHPPSKVTEELIRVPLLLRVPGVSRKEPAIAPFSLIDLAPTLLETVSVSVPGSFRGASRFQQLRRGENWEGTAVIESVSGCTNPYLADNRLGTRILAIREERHKLVLDFGSSREQLFDLEADPSELFSLPPDAEKPARRRLLERARQHIADSLQLRDPDQRLGARLRDLRLEWAHSATKVPT
jgi:arylsulfatase A-like enzyme